MNFLAGGVVEIERDGYTLRLYSMEPTDGGVVICGSCVNASGTVIKLTGVKVTGSIVKAIWELLKAGMSKKPLTTGEYLKPVFDVADILMDIGKMSFHPKP